MSNQIKQFEESPKIYNLFPRLVGNVKNWLPHIERAYEMGFNWIYINPFHPTGSSGSLYAIKDHFGFNPLFFGSQDHGRPASHLKAMIREANKLGLNVMADLVINHTSKQSPLVCNHPDWYKRDDKGRLIHPGAMHKGKMVYWRDLAEIDNLNSQNRDSLWAYWLSVIKNYLDLGFTGFRCDAAYQVPTDLWRFLIEEAKQLNPASAFFAETLGCPVEQTLEVAKSGFDYIFNSFKWWNLQDNWFTDQLRLTQPIAASVSFPESHDTTRLAADLKDNIPSIKQRYLLSALLTKGVMIPIGFEFGFHKKLNVKLTSTEDWEDARFDLSGFIKEVNLLKGSQHIFNQELPLQRVPAQNPDIIILLKDNKNTAMEKKERFLLIININNSKAQTLNLDLNSMLPGGVISDLSPEDNLGDVPRLFDIKLKPYQVRILHHSF
ncbi:MAG: alpha-amylase family glycosyl hydrolase [bacterium]